MKCILFLFFILNVPTFLKAQSFNEWLRQNRTQRKYLGQQIAALQIQVETVQKGYSIASEGLQRIGVMKQGDFGLHQNHLNALKKVNPTMLSYSRAKDILHLQSLLLENQRQQARLIQQDDAFTAQEQAFFLRVLARLMVDCESVLDELLLLTSDFKLELKDGERLQQLMTLHQHMLDQTSFLNRFSSDVQLLSRSRKRAYDQVHQESLFHDLTKRR